jgi:predicted metal-binding membrane protein
VDRPWTRGFAAPLLLAAVAAWALLAGPEAGIGTMGMAPAEYLVMWTGMTAAMMLAPLAWFAAGYTAAIRRDCGATLGHVARTISLACGYALVWLLAGLVALLLAVAVDQLATRWPAAVPWAGGAALLVAGGYQISSVKARCLARCRSPLSFALAPPASAAFCATRAWAFSTEAGASHVAGT